LCIRRPANIRENYVIAVVRKFLRQMGIQSPPVSIKKLLKQFGRLFYFSNEQGYDFPEEKGFSYPVGDIYHIYINKDLPNGRDNFTYAHELAHIVLNHHFEFDIDYLTNRELWMLDREADIFAVRCLMPKQWVRSCISLPLNVPEIGRLKKIFDVSWEAMINRLDELQILSKENARQLFNEWKIARSGGKLYIAENKIDYKSGINYCTSIKGKVVRSSANKFKDIRLPEVDENMRFIDCPACGNNSFSSKAKFCKKCGQYLYNLCINIETDPRYNHEYCGKANMPDALYCEYCGAKTMVLELLDKMGLSEVATTKEIRQRKIDTHNG